MIKVYQSKIAKYAGHTAGPWRWVNPTTDESRCSGEMRSSLRTVKEYPAQFTFGRTLPEWVLDAEISDGETMEANAALIADAPYLACEVERLRELCGELVGALEAAKQLIDFEVYIPEIHHTCGTPDSIEPCCVMARIQSAISNAKGEIDE